MIDDCSLSIIGIGIAFGIWHKVFGYQQPEDVIISLLLAGVLLAIAEAIEQ